MKNWLVAPGPGSEDERGGDADSLRRSQPHELATASHGDRDGQRNLADLLERGINAPLLQVALRDQISQRMRRLQEHLVGHQAAARCDDPKAHPGENIRIVALPRHIPFAVELHRRERAAAGENRRAPAPLIRLRSGAFRLGGGVGKRKNNGPARHPRDGLDDRLRESSLLAGSADERGGPEGFDDGEGIFQRLVILRERQLLLVEIRAALDHQPLGIDKPAGLAGLCLAEPFTHQRGDHQLPDARPRLACAEKEQALVAKLPSRDAERGINARQRHRSRALNVVVERANTGAVFVQETEGVVIGKIFELDQRPGEGFRGGGDELLHQGVVDFARGAALVQAEVQRVVQQRLVVGADVDQHRQTLRGVEPRTRGVEGELSNGNAHAVGPEIAQAQNALAIGHNDHADVPARPVAQHPGNVPHVLLRNIHAVRTPENLPKLLARQAHGGRVDQGHHLFDEPGHDMVIERLIAILQRGEVDVAFQIRRPFPVGAKEALHLVVNALDMRRHQAAQAQGVTLGFAKGGSFVQGRVLHQAQTGGHILWIRFH